MQEGLLYTRPKYGTVFVFYETDKKNRVNVSYLDKLLITCGSQYFVEDIRNCRNKSFFDLINATLETPTILLYFKCIDTVN